MVPGDGIALLMPFLMGWNRGRFFTSWAKSHLHPS
jgi:hypothetical protein